MGKVSEIVHSRLGEEAFSSLDSPVPFLQSLQEHGEVNSTSLTRSMAARQRGGQEHNFWFLAPGTSPSFFLKENFQEVLFSVVKPSRLEFLFIVRLWSSLLAEDRDKNKVIMAILNKEVTVVREEWEKASLATIHVKMTRRCWEAASSTGADQILHLERELMQA